MTCQIISASVHANYLRQTIVAASKKLSVGIIILVTFIVSTRPVGVVSATSSPSKTSVNHPVECHLDEECHIKVHPLSTCRSFSGSGIMFCSNPFESGCFYALETLSRSKDNQNHRSSTDQNVSNTDNYEKRHSGRNKRVCNSEDHPLSVDVTCQRPAIEYMEIRISNLNWESVYIEAFLLQIILSEFLDVPTSIETEDPNTHMNFYDPYRRYDSGGRKYEESLKSAADFGDCRLVNQHHVDYTYDTDHNSVNSTLVYDSSSTTTTPYTSCAHVVTEMWNMPVAYRMEREKIIEAPQGLGVLSQEGWFIPKFTAARNPMLLSWMGMAGDTNRRTLAKTFNRPTTWRDYCILVSSTHCSEPDDVAKRPPLTEFEEESYFLEPQYTGHFRATDENDCERHPTTCTGHIVDFPCGWTSEAIQQSHHLDIAVRGSGPEGTLARGYSYRSMTEIWMAANFTKSDVLMYWWTPGTDIDLLFAGTDAELTRVMLPQPTNKCAEARSSRYINSITRCDETSMADLIGDPVAACDMEPFPIQKVISRSLREASYDSSIPEALRSPSYDFLRLFTLDTLQLSEILEYKKNYVDTREAVCHWAFDHEDWIKGFVPNGFPRQIVADDSTSSPLQLTSFVVGIIAAMNVVITAFLVFWYRQLQAMKSAQIEFLVLLIVGLLFSAIGSTLRAVPTTDGSCVSIVWFLTLGTTVELVPLLIKMSAINRLMQAAKGHRRVTIQRSMLFRIVAVVISANIVFLVVWTIIDPPQSKSGYTLVSGPSKNEVGSDVDEAMSSIVQESSYCSSTNSFWYYVHGVWKCILLVSGSVLAFQSRNIRMKDFNESLTVGMIMYTQTLFLVTTLIIRYALVDEADPGSRVSVSYYESIIMSVETMTTCAIYFGPKFFQNRAKRSSSTSSLYLDFMASSVMDKFGYDGNSPPLQPNDRTYTVARPFRLSDIEKQSSSSSETESYNDTSRKFDCSNSCPRCGHTFLESDQTMDQDIQTIHKYRMHLHDAKDDPGGLGSSTSPNIHANSLHSVPCSPPLPMVDFSSSEEKQELSDDHVADGHADVDVDITIEISDDKVADGHADVDVDTAIDNDRNETKLVESDKRKCTLLLPETSKEKQGD